MLLDAFNAAICCRHWWWDRPTTFLWCTLSQSRGIRCWAEVNGEFGIETCGLRSRKPLQKTMEVNKSNLVYY